MPLIFIIFAMFLAAMPAVGQSDANRSEWVLKQDAGEMGKHTTYVSQDAVKIVSDSHGYEVLAKAPDWRVYCYRPDAKKLWIGDLNQFSSDVMLNPFAVPNVNVIRLNLHKEVSYHGLKCTRFSRSVDRMPVVFGADDIAASPMACEFLARYYDITKIDKVPIFCIVHVGKQGQKAGQAGWLDLDIVKDLRGGDEVKLSTSATKKIPFNAKDFDYPHNYKKIAEIGQIPYSKDKLDEMNKMVDSIGFTSREKKEPIKQKGR